MAAPKSELEVWLTFLSSFVWPATLLVALVMFRKQLQPLLGRLSSLKVAGTEMAFQAPAADAPKTPPVDKSNLVEIDSEAFLTETGIREVVRKAGLLGDKDEIYRAMVIFSTQKQKTWLAFSKQKVFCVLDDAETRKAGRVVQWVLPREQARPVKAHPYKATIGLLDIGTRTHWLYSTRLFPEPALIEKEIKSAISEGG